MNKLTAGGQRIVCLKSRFPFVSVETSSLPSYKNATCNSSSVVINFQHDCSLCFASIGADDDDSFKLYFLCEISAYNKQLTFRRRNLKNRSLKTVKQRNSPKNMKQACTNGWSKVRGGPLSRPTDSILSAHLRMKTMQNICVVEIKIVAKSKKIKCQKVTSRLRATYFVVSVFSDPVITRRMAKNIWYELNAMIKL